MIIIIIILRGITRLVRWWRGAGGSQVPNITGNCSSVGSALAGDLPNLELGEGSVGSFVEVGEGQSVSLVGPQSLHPAQHPVVVFALLGLADVIGCPALVPGAPLLPLPGADQRVGL